ncbi:MAG: phospho-N-acetylmuramoyl-pentapeptide-transferase [bacterium]
MFLKLFFIFITSLFCFWALIYILNKRHIFQYIYKLTPPTHQHKTHIPSFGGCVFLLMIILSYFLFEFTTPKIGWILCCFFTFSLIGFGDDLISALRHKNDGLSAKAKFLLQCLSACLLMLYFHFYIEPLSLFYFLFFIFLFVATSNACNLSDGLDGLLTGSSLISLGSFSLLFFHMQLPIFSLFCFCLMSILSAFLFFNRHPAVLFMGDTGSLALGAFFVALACCANNPWVLLAFAALFLIEALSVILQVSYFKTTKKRFFLMAPLHHHFECLGLNERHIVLIFWIIHLLFCSIYLVKLFNFM